ncbi:MAG: ATP-binding protein [Acidimicrobiia bacterium]
MGRSRATILVLGVALTVLSVISLGMLRAETLTAELDAAGSDLIASAQAGVGTAVERTRSLAALFEASSEVTPDEFSRYGRTLGPGVGIVEIGFQDLSGSEPLRFGYGDAELGNLSLLSMPDLDEVIAGFDGSREPVLLGMADGSRAVVVVAPAVAGDTGEIGGLVYTVAELSALAAGPSEGLSHSFGELNGATLAAPTAVAEERLWRAVAVVAERPWVFEVARTAPPTLDVSLLLVALFGLVGSVLAASRIALREEKVATEFALDALRRATADKDRFMASVSHELRTPLTSVVGLSSILEASWRDMDESEVQKMITDVHHEGRELADLVEDLLTIGRVESGVLTYRPTMIDLDVEIGRVVDRIMIPRHVRVAVTDSLGSARADALRVRQIIRNLLANAARHAQSVITITPVECPGTVGVRISNDGPGIPRDQAERLFQAYQAGLRAGQPGSIGLGLYVSRQLARGMGGELGFVPEGQLVVFELTLPTPETAMLRRAGSTVDGSRSEGIAS